MNKPSNTKKATVETLELDSFEILRAIQFKNGHVSFDARLNGIYIYGISVVESKNGDFLSFPQRQGKDGKYYHIVYCKLDEKTQADIIKEVEAKLAE